MKALSGLNEFYGNEAQLRAYHARFLRFIEDAPPDLPALDLGCGTGVFLKLLLERGRLARGVGRAGAAVAECRRKGLDFEDADALPSLAAQPHASYGATYCCHLIEHCAYDDACGLLDGASRALAPKARIIIITPNPVSPAVISENFWLDPTHVRPYPLALLRRMRERAGFDLIAVGHDDPPGLPRRLWLRLILGKQYGGMNSLVVSVKR